MNDCPDYRDPDAILTFVLAFLADADDEEIYDVAALVQSILRDRHSTCTT